MQVQILEEQLRLLRFVSAECDGQYPKAAIIPSGNDARTSTARHLVQLWKHINQRSAASPAFTSSNELDALQPACSVNKAIGDSIEVLTDLQACCSGMFTKWESAYAQTKAYQNAASELLTTIETYYSSHLQTPCSDNPVHSAFDGCAMDEVLAETPDTIGRPAGLTDKQHEAVRAEVQRLKDATAATRLQLAAVKAYRVKEEAKLMHLQRTAASLQTSSQPCTTDVAEQESSKKQLQQVETQLLQQLEKLAAEYAECKAFGVLQTDYQLKVLRQHYALECKQSVNAALLKQAAQLALLRQAIHKAEQGVNGTAAIVVATQQLAQQLTQGADRRSSIMRALQRQRQQDMVEYNKGTGQCVERGLHLEAGPIPALQQSMEAMLKHIKVDSSEAAHTGDSGDEDEKAGVAAALPIKVDKGHTTALEQLAAQQQELATHLEHLLCTLSQRQQQLAHDRVLALQRKVLKYAFTNPRKLHSLARA